MPTFELIREQPHVLRFCRRLPSLILVWHRCCIDKTSSAELSEAINSIFTWYQKAEVCYA
ncbi:hypothetical protein F4782DRAFT_495477 [Xylaria castorea]|nr:hypothetical protein F4782DRAFT_495477 [Xylaria castorea]